MTWWSKRPMDDAFDAEQSFRDMQSLWQGGVPHEEDFRAFGSFERSSGAVRLLDCGANAGQSAISFLMNCPNGSVVSFEPNRLYGAVLSRLATLLGPERFSYHLEGLSDAEGDLDLHVPYVDGVPYLQEATLDLSQFDKPWVADRLNSYGAHLEIKPLRAHFSTADSKNLTIDVVKIDAEGAEMRVLLGMQQTIDRCRPIFLIENNDWHAVTAFLERLGYAPYRWDTGARTLVHMSGESTNCFYLASEHRGFLPMRSD
jgi:FkbM family methyltransferase